MSETPEARTRRRWINLGEIVAVAGVIIAALSFWDAHSDRTAPKAAAVARIAPLILTGTVADDGARIDLRPATADQVIQTQTIRFPTVVRGDAVDTTGNARIEAAWFDAGLRGALREAKVKGRHRLAVGVETVYMAGDDRRTDRAVYDIGYSLHERFLRPDAVVIEGVSLVEPRVGKDLQRRVDVRFAGQAVVN